MNTNFNRGALPASAKLMAFCGTAKANEARAFYRDKLGLAIRSEDDFAIVFDAQGATLRVTKVQEVFAAPYTVLGWQVDDVDSAALNLRSAGVELQRFSGLNDKDELGIWTAPGGVKIIWFKDSDGNLLSVSSMR